jgi:hypothetical protein
VNIKNLKLQIFNLKFAMESFGSIATLIYLRKEKRHGQVLSFMRRAIEQSGFQEQGGELLQILF